MNVSTLVRQKKGRTEFRQTGFVGLAVIVLYLLLYVFQPFSPFLNNLLSDFFTVAVAASSMIVALRITRRYEPSDAPRKIWGQLAIGLSVWTLAEVIWAVYNLMYGEVGLTSADLLWVLAYGFFIRALLLQYKLLVAAGRAQVLQWLIVWCGSILSLTLIIAWFLAMFTGEHWGLPLIVGAFYPAADLVVGLASLGIVNRFRGGALGYPWIGLFMFAFADLLYAALEFSGAYSWSVSNGNLLSTVADVSYTAAYLLVALGCYVQLLLLRYGPIFELHKASKETS